MEIFVLLSADNKSIYAFANEVLLRDMLDSMARTLLLFFPKTSMNPWSEMLLTWTKSQGELPLTLQLGENTAYFTVLKAKVLGTSA